MCILYFTQHKKFTCLLHMVETIEFHGNILDIPNNKALRIHQWITKQINKRASSFCSFYFAFASGRQIRQVGWWHKWRTVDYYAWPEHEPPTNEIHWPTDSLTLLPFLPAVYVLEGGGGGALLCIFAISNVLSPKYPNVLSLIPVGLRNISPLW